MRKRWELSSKLAEKVKEGLEITLPKLHKTVVNKLALAVGAMIEAQTPNTIELVNVLPVPTELKSNLQEVEARGGELHVFADEDSHIPESVGIHTLRLPEHYGKLSPIPHVIPLQLLAYHAALAKGTDVDKPRNLAKSVTVE